jgi:acetyl-CoA acyltransferase 1
MAQLRANIPHTVPIHSVNRLCSSGLQAVASIANAIRSGDIECGIGGGVESMSLYDMTATVNPELISDAIFDHPAARNCMVPMGLTSENVAEQFGITRQ